MVGRPNSKFLNIRQDRYDVWKAGCLLEVAECAYGDVIEDRAMRILYHDLWAALYKRDPELRKGYHPESLMQRRVLEDLMQRPEFLKLRAHTESDAHAAAQGAGHVMKAVKNRFEQPEEDPLEDIPPEDAEDAEEEMEGVPIEELTKEEKELLEELLKNADKIAAAISEKAVDDAIEKVEEVKIALRMLGRGYGRGRGRGMTPADKSKLVIRLIKTPGLRDLIMRAGRMSFFAQSKQREKYEHGRDEIDGIEFSDDIENIVSDEYAQLADPTGLLTMEFYRKFAEGELQVHTFSGERDIEGPVILCIDQSGSMSGSPDQWAKALGLSLADLCREQQRDFHVIYFDMRVVGEMTFPKGDGDFIEFLTRRMSGGGTAFEPPLERCLAIIKGAKDMSGATDDTWRKADVIFLTDDQCALNQLFIERWKREKAELHQRLFAIFIGHYADKDVRNSCLAPIADAAFFTHPSILDEKHEALDVIFTNV